MAGDDDKLEEELRKRWDPDKLSRFLKLREGEASRLDLSTRSRYERRFGVDLGDVRVFQGELAAEIAKAHDAEALTVGSTGMIVMGGSSKFTPGTAAGQALLAHELTHVAQAKPSTIARKGVSDAPLATEQSEREAEEHEAAVHAEEMGGGDRPVDAEKDARRREKHERVLKRVMELMEADRRLTAERNGYL